MADVLYVGLQDDDKIVSFGLDAGAAKLVPRAETPAVGAPSVFAVSMDRRALYVGYRGTPGIERCRIATARRDFRRGPVDLSRRLDDATFAAIERAYNEYGVIFFRGQSMTPAQQVAFTRRFGEAEIDRNPPVSFHEERAVKMLSE